jgi:hypothetical protein
MNSTYPSYVPSSMPRHNAMPAARPTIRHNTSKSEAGAVLGSSTSPAKAKAAQANGAKGGRPSGS